MKHVLRLAVLTVLLVQTAVAGAEHDLAFIHLRVLTVEEATELAQTLLSPNGRVTGVPSRRLLVVQDRPDKIEAIRTLIRKTEGPPVNIRVEVRFAEERNHRRRGAGIEGGGIRVERRNGDTGVSGNVGVRFESRSRQETASTTQFVVTANGHPARIRAVESVADPVWVYHYGLRHGWWERDFIWRDLGASLWVRPRLVGDNTVEVQVYPRLTSRGDKPLSLDVKDVSTSVVTRSGTPVQIGELDEARSRFYRHLLGGGRILDERRLNIVITPYVQGRAPHRPSR